LSEGGYLQFTAAIILKDDLGASYAGYHHAQEVLMPLWLLYRNH
jgi:hypothetical protein